MSNQVTLDQIKEQVNLLSWHDQLTLIGYISEQLSSMPVDIEKNNNDLLQKQRDIEAERLIARCKAVGRMWKGNFDAIEDIRQIREERDEKICSNK